MVTWHSIRMIDDGVMTAEQKIADALNRWQTTYPNRRIVGVNITTGRLLRSGGIYAIGIFSSEEVAT